MLMDILGVLIGFAAVMLLFSLLTSAIVHGAQATLNLRLKTCRVLSLPSLIMPIT